MATILLADDSDEIRAVYGPVLRMQGHEVFEAADGRQAVEMARRVAPDLVLLDVWMPGLNGFEVLDQLRVDPTATRTRVAMLSVLEDAEVQLDAFGAGAIEYLVKGVSLEEFVQRVEGLLQHQMTSWVDDPVDP